MMDTDTDITDIQQALTLQVGKDELNKNTFLESKMIFNIRTLLTLFCQQLANFLTPPFIKRNTSDIV